MLLPSVALLGLFQGARQVEAKAKSDRIWLAEPRRTAVRANPAAREMLWQIALRSWTGYAGALVLVLGARGVRRL